MLSALVILAAGYFQTGNQLIDACADDGAGRSLCLGYVEGVSDTAQDRSGCIPVGVQASQLADVVTNYLSSHPESRQMPAAVLVRTAFSQAWPCPPVK